MKSRAMVEERRIDEMRVFDDTYRLSGVGEGRLETIQSSIDRFVIYLSVRCSTSFSD